MELSTCVVITKVSSLIILMISLITNFCIRIIRWVAAQSIFYHLYNQVSYMSLDEISPLTFSIGNTMKRISVIVSSIIIFQTPVRPINALGAAIAILGTFIYSQVSFFFFFLTIGLYITWKFCFTNILFWTWCLNFFADFSCNSVKD